MSQDNVELGDYLQRGLTVAQLIEQLQSMPQEAQVVYAYNYGDHWRTQVAECVQTVEEKEVQWSAYHSMPKLVDLDDDHHDDDKSVDVVVLC